VTCSVDLVKQLSSNMFRSLKDLSPNVAGVMSASRRVERAWRGRYRIAGVDTTPNVGMKRVYEVISMQKENVGARIPTHRRKSPPDRLVLVGVSSPLLLSPPSQTVLKTPPANGCHYMPQKVAKLTGSSNAGILTVHLVVTTLT
jgi:hypothetical protein